MLLYIFKLLFLLDIIYLLGIFLNNLEFASHERPCPAPLA